MTDANPLQRRIDELEGLNRLAQALCSSMELEHVLRAIIDASAALCRAQHAAILLLDPITKESVKTLVHQRDPARVSIEHTVNMIVAGWVLEHRQPLMADDLVAGVGIKNPPERYRKYGSVLAVPLSVSGEIIGIMNLVNDASGEKFTHDSLRIASIIAQQSAQFIHNAKLQESLFAENERLKQELRQQYRVHGIVGISKKMKAVLDLVPLVAKSTATVLLCGETGTGKELVARAIHFQSDRAEKAFVPLNCAAIPANLIESELFGHEKGAFTGASNTVIGKFELAHGGTIFLDEISEMPLDLQPKLLRLLEEKKFFRLGSSIERTIDTRVIAATNKNLQSLVQEGKFREDLFYRLNVMPVFLPPLRERIDDIPVLAEHFLSEFSHGTKKFSQAALLLLQENVWRGNVRELRNIVERISLLIPSDVISEKHLQTLNIGTKLSTETTSPAAAIVQSMLSTGDGKGDLLEEMERLMVQVALEESHGSVSAAARLLGIDRKALDRRKEKFGL